MDNNSAIVCLGFVVLFALLMVKKHQNQKYVIKMKDSITFYYQFSSNDDGS